VKGEFAPGRLRYNCRVPKRPCSQRAEWRLVPGKAPQRLSVHYQLACDYGTPLITIFKQSDGNEPVYLCEAHIAELERMAPVVAAKNRFAAPVIAQPVIAGKDRLPDAPRADRLDQPTQSRDTRTPAIAQHTTARPTETLREKVDQGASERVDLRPEGTDPRNLSPAKEISVPAAASVAKLTRPGVLGRAPKDPLRPRVRDLTYGDSAKALVDEAIWNLAPGDLDVYRTALREGKPAIEAAQCAGGQLAVIVRKISEYEQTLEALLTQSKPIISVVQVIHQPLERVLLDLIGNHEIHEAEKDAAIERLGALEESLNRGLAPEITLLQALKITVAVGERANWGTSADLTEELKPAYGAVYASLKNSIGAAVPETASVFERLANLSVAKAELETAHPANLSHDEDVESTAAPV
jgi:hypothetical protein